MPRIGLDARSMTAPRPRGTGRNLLDAYRRLPGMRPGWEFLLYHQSTVRPDDTSPQVAGDPPWRQPNVHLRHVDLPGDRWGTWLHLRLPLAALMDRVDLLHLPANVAPAWCPVPYVVTIHDLVPLKVPGEFDPQHTRAFRRSVARAVRGARHIITPSQATCDDLHESFAVPRDRMTVIPWAADSAIAAESQRALSAGERDRLRQRYGVGDRWLLSFSGSSRRKNARGVLDGFARVPLALRRRVQVVLVGCEPAECRQKLAADAERLGLSDQCRVLGFVPHEDLPGLLRGASGLLIPSYCEGFGLPVLDAFACGVPVLSSRAGSLPEVAGDAAVYCQPNDAATIAEGIGRLLDSRAAADLAARGRQRIAQFTWDRTAGAMCAVYEHCLRPTAARRRLPAGAGKSGRRAVAAEVRP